MDIDSARTSKPKLSTTQMTASLIYKLERPRGAPVGSEQAGATSTCPQPLLRDRVASGDLVGHQPALQPVGPYCTMDEELLREGVDTSSSRSVLVHQRKLLFYFSCQPQEFI